MQAKTFNRSDQTKFVKGLYDYASRGINQKVKAAYAEKTGMTENTFRDKMCSHRTFRDFELDVIEQAYRTELGDESFFKQHQAFIDHMCDGDRRTNEGVQDTAIAQLAAQNEGMAVSKILV